MKLYIRYEETVSDIVQESVFQTCDAFSYAAYAGRFREARKVVGQSVVVEHCGEQMHFVVA